jgi:hypothetical protein
MRFAFGLSSGVQNNRISPEALQSPSELGRPCKLAALLFAVVGLFLAGTRSACAENGNSSGHGDPHVFRVVDKYGKFVGYSLSENLVAREINGSWVTFYVHPGTGIFDSRAIYVQYLTTDCTGTRYISHYSTFSEGTRVGSALYYPTDTQVLSPRSLRVVSGNGEEGVCSPASGIPGVYGVATTIEVDSFGLEVPFKAIQ